MVQHRQRATRRGFLAGVAATAAVAASPASAQSGFGGWFDDVSNYDGVVDRTGQSTVAVTVGAQGNGGTFAFAPPAIRVDPGTTVTFEWASDTHNVKVESQPSGANWEGHTAIENTGFSFEHAFQTEGVYKYFCAPHRAMGMKGAIVVGGSASGGSDAGSGGSGSGAAPGGGGSGDGPASAGSESALVRYATVGFGGALVAALLALPWADARSRDVR